KDQKDERSVEVKPQEDQPLEEIKLLQLEAPVEVTPQEDQVLEEIKVQQGELSAA
ncbi:unnamed protein product, partial [Rotaria magnacalcarata]